MEKNDSKSLMMLVSSMVIFGTIGIFRRNVPLSSPALAFCRGLFGAVFLVILSAVQHRKIRNGIGYRKVLYLILTGVVNGANWICLFEAYNYTTVATATLCYYMQPVIVILLSPLVFGEKLSVKKIVCCVSAVIGMAFVAGFAETGIPTLAESRGIIMGLAAASFYALLVILNKKMSGIDPYEKTVIQLTTAAVMLLPYLALTGNFSTAPLTLKTGIFVIILGFIHTGLAYALYFGSMDKLRAQTVAIFGYIDPILALILGRVILKEKMTVFGIIGTVLILGSAIISETNFKKKS